MNRVWRIALTALVLAFLVPVLVLASVAAGLAPRHWSGIPLSGWDLALIDFKPEQGRLTGPPGQPDPVVDGIIAMDDPGVFMVVPLHDGSVYVASRSLRPSLFLELGSRFDADQVSVVWSPLMGDINPDAGDRGPARTFWQRTEPLATWVTLMVGFPWQLGAGLLLVAAGYTLRARRRAKAGDAEPAAS
ncbi:hypothetical protein [Catellatospora bangladeshensis]|uniref:Uncharacterized protein n=1 Tax=Catellatospora bangladeshensis TaxID=310355 RepID=A0A8J3J9J4_9ACTN|nr:hypothetical protein [Catellatospora bangladeshensis]GIF80121.1 hypothetical protein Cba03nite_14700 [Catellatospora bangladeshensis]